VRRAKIKIKKGKKRIIIKKKKKILLKAIKTYPIETRSLAENKKRRRFKRYRRI
jgi:hypothetical protein